MHKTALCFGNIRRAGLAPCYTLSGTPGCHLSFSTGRPLSCPGRNLRNNTAPTIALSLAAEAYVVGGTPMEPLLQDP